MFLILLLLPLLLLPSASAALTVTTAAVDFDDAVVDDATTDCSTRRAFRIKWDLKHNSDYAEKNALVLVNLPREFVRITRSLL